MKPQLYGGGNYKQLGQHGQPKCFLQGCVPQEKAVQDRPVYWGFTRKTTGQIGARVGIEKRISVIPAIQTKDNAPKSSSPKTLRTFIAFSERCVALCVSHSARPGISAGQKYPVCG